jgi:hypothetical protein
MKKLATITASAVYFLNAISVLAQGANPNFPGAAVSGRAPQGPNITVTPPNVGYSNLGGFITAAINMAFIVAGLAVLVMLVWGAIQWIFSGGDKEGVAHARSRIINALIGLAILAVAIAIAVVFGRFAGINLFDAVIPTPFNTNPPQPLP